MRSMPTPGLWATVWSPLRTQCSDVVRSSSQRQPMRRDHNSQRPPPRPREHPWPWCWVGARPLLLQPRTPASLPAARPTLMGPGSVRTVPSGQLLVGLAPSSTPAALAPAAACTSERNTFLSALDGGVRECWYETEPPLPSCPRWGARRWGGCVFTRTLSQILKFPGQGMASVPSEWTSGASHRCRHSHLFADEEAGTGDTGSL